MATKTDTLLIDQDGDGTADPGDTLRYTIEVANASSVDATGVMVDDPLDTNTTLVPNSILSTPLAYNQAMLTAEDIPLAITLTGADADGDTLTFTVTVPPIYGTLTGTAPNLTYTPNSGYLGADRFTFQVCDTATPPNCDTAAIDIQVSSINDPPTFTGGADQTAIEDAGPQSVPGWATGISAGPPDEAGQALTFVVTNNTNPSLFASGPAVAADGTLTYTPAADANGFATITLELRDDGGVLGGGDDTSAPDTFIITITPINDAPVVTPATFALAENSPNATVVGGVTFSDPDAGQTHSFSITAGNTSGAFAIDSTSGQITVANSAALNFETNPSFSLTVQVVDNDPAPLSGTANVTITLTDVNEAPAVTPATLTLDENSSNGTIVGSVTATDPDTGQTLSYSITAGNTGGAFAIDPTSGQITVATSSALDFETTPSFGLTVQVIDTGSPALSSTATITINLNNLNDPPIVTPATFTLDENSSNGSVVGTVTASDSDVPAQTLTYSITAGNTGGAFAIDPTSGQITVATSIALDFETTPSFALTVQVSDNGAPVQSGTATITINLNQQNDLPVVNDQTFSIAENSGAGAIVGTVVATDADVPAQTLNYAITAGNTGGAFAIDSATGQLTVANTAAIDFETISSFNLTVQVTDNGTPNLADTATVTINVTNLNEAPTANDASFTLDENSANATVVGSVTVTDPDSGQTLSFAITAGNTGGAFAINPTSGQITVANSTALNFETNPTFNLTVTVTDNGTGPLSDTASVTINLNNLNEAPTADDATFALDENSPNGTVVGSVSATDPDTGQTLTYAITAGNGSGAFAINPTTGQITVADSTQLSFELNPVFNLTVTVTDNGAGTLSDTATITINLNNLNESPQVNDQSFSVDENSANGTVVGTVLASDPDTGQTLTYAVTAGNGSGAFAINPTTGQITVADSTQLNFEATPSFALTVSVTDNGAGNLSDTATITVNVNNLNEAPVLVDTSFSLDENSANGTAVGTLTAFNPDAGQTLNYAITAGNTGSAFAINATTGQLTVANSAAVNFEATPSFSLTITVTDNGVPALSDTATVTINLNNLNEAPIAGDVTFTLTENSPNGTVVGSISATDPDTGQTLTYAITAGNTGGAFAINPTTGQITVANSAAVNFEATPSFSLMVTVTDNGTGPLSDTASVTINLNNVNEAPVLPDASFSIDENRPNGTVVGSVSATDPDAGQTLTYAITAGNTGSAFAINPTTGQITVATVAAVDFETNPTFNLTVTVTDNGVPVLSDTAAVTITLNNVPEAPIVMGESYATIGNTLLQVAATDTATPPHIFVSGNLLSNDVDPDGPTTLTASLNTASAGAVVTVNSDGSFTYVPPPGAGPTDSFTYNVSDGTLSSVGTVMITLSGEVWYVQNNAPAGGLGRSSDPFDTLVEAQTASGPGDTIYVFTGNGTTTGQNAGFALQNNQRLLGEGVALTVPVSVNGGPNPTVLRAAGTAPQIGNGGGNGVTALNDGTLEIRGLNISGTTNAIEVGTSGANTSSATITNNSISAAGQEGIEINADSTGTLTVDVQTNAIASAGNGFDARSSAGALRIGLSNNTNITSGATGILIDGSGGGTITITGFANNTIHQNTVNTGVNITSATFDATPGGAFNQVTGGTTTIGVSGDGVGGAGMILTTVSGDLSFTDLDIVASNGSGLSVTGTAAFTGAAGTRFSVGAGLGTIVSTNGPAVNISAATIDLQLSTITVNSSPTNGVSLVNVSDASVAPTAASFSAGSGSSIANVTGTDFTIDGGNATISYGGSITNTAGRSVSIVNRTGDSVTFANTNTINDTGQGILVNANAAASATNFQGTLTLSTGANAAFTATSGGTIQIQGTANTLVTTTGTALNVTNTTIGLSGLTFQSISASGAANGIVLNNTGTTAGTHGGLTVTGTAAANSGGTIQNTTSDAISLTNTRDASFNRMNIQNPGASGVNGTQVTNFTFTNSTVNDAGDALEESAIAFNTNKTVDNNLNGTLTVTGNTLTNSYYSGLDVQSGDGTITQATVSNNTITNTTNGLGINFVGTCTNTTCFRIDNADINQNNITNTRGHGIQVQVSSNTTGTAVPHAGLPNDATKRIDITNNSIDPAPNGTQAMAVVTGSPNAGARAKMNFLIECNGKNTGGCTSPTAAALGSSDIGTVILIGNNGYSDMVGTVNNNIIAATHTVGGGGANGIGGGNGVSGAGNAWTPDLTLTVTNNTISGTDGNGILLVGRSTSGTGRFKIQNNNVGAPLSGLRPGIRVDAGNAASADDAVFVNISGNTSAGSGGQPGIGIRKQGTVATTNDFGINGLSPSPATAAQAEDFVSTLNPGSALGTSSDGVTQKRVLAINGSNFIVTSLPLHASGGEGPGATSITQAELTPIAAEAISRWQAAGISQTQAAQLAAATITLADLPDGKLGEADMDGVTIDANAAGWGWFVDATPADSAEFVGGRASGASPAHGRMDLLTVVMHELGHVIGYEDLSVTEHPNALMAEELHTATRRLPGTEAASTLAISPQAASSFPLTIGTLPTGKRVTITFDVVINNPLPLSVAQIWNQARVTGTNVTLVFTDDPETPTPSDATITPIGRFTIALPLVVRQSYPDLVVDQISTAGGTLEIVIRNQGQSAVTTAFWVDLYINPAQAPTSVNQTWQTQGARGLTWGVEGAALPIAPGGTLTLRVGDALYWAELSQPGGPLVAGTPLFAQVDSANTLTNHGGVLETHEELGGLYNNILGPVTSGNVVISQTRTSAVPVSNLPPR